MEFGQGACLDELGGDAVGRGNDLNVLRSFTYTPRPESGRDCLICATFAWKGACLDELAGVRSVVDCHEGDSIRKAF